ncbi:MAG: hypothetical protein JNL58_26585 [Planctomyces sp.]|nr:hypothetical protein [Planctomyces sp.]
MGWFLFGGLGMMIGIGLSAVLGLTSKDFVIGLGSLIIGPIVGFGIRFGAGTHTSGVGPGLFATFLAFVAIICGKFGAYSLSDIGFTAPDAEVATEGQASFIEEYEKEHMSEPALIARIASKLLEEWVLAGKLTEEQLAAVWDTVDAKVDPSLDFLPEVWQEASNRWNGMTPDVQAATVRDVQQKHYGDEMTPSEDQVKEWIASSVTDEWLEAGRITTEQIEAHDAEQLDSIIRAAYERAFPPEVWQEANNRWAAMSPEQKEALKEEVRVEMKHLIGFRETFRAAVSRAQVVSTTLLSCFWPLYNPTFFLLSMVAAYRLGSHNESKR